MLPIQAIAVAGVAVAVFAVSACTTMQPYVAVAPRQTALVDSMVALAPGAGAVLGVVETVYVNAIEQKISLETKSKTPGQNYIKVQYFKTAATSPVEGGLQDVPLANQDMAGEARGTVSNADMKLSPYFVQNAYGPFGYSMGRTATGDTCMYAWQRIPPPRVAATSPWKTVNVRALICASDQTEQQLLDVMLQLRLKEVAGQGQVAPSDIGAYGAIISPFGSGPANVLPVTASAPAAAPSRSSRPTVLPPVLSTPGPVPSPPGATSSMTVPAPTSGPVPIVPSPH